MTLHARGTLGRGGGRTGRWLGDGKHPSGKGTGSLEVVMEARVRDAEGKGRDAKRKPGMQEGSQGWGRGGGRAAECEQLPLGLGCVKS